MRAHCEGYLPFTWGCFGINGPTVNVTYCKKYFQTMHQSWHFAKYKKKITLICKSNYVFSRLKKYIWKCRFWSDKCAKASGKNVSLHSTSVSHYGTREWMYVLRIQRSNFFAFDTDILDLKCLLLSVSNKYHSTTWEVTFRFAQNDSQWAVGITSLNNCKCLPSKVHLWLQTNSVIRLSLLRTFKWGMTWPQTFKVSWIKHFYCENQNWYLFSIW